MISIAETEGAEHAVVQFFCPEAQQAEAVKQAVRAATGLDLVVSVCECAQAYVIFHSSNTCARQAQQAQLGTYRGK